MKVSVNLGPGVFARFPATQITGVLKDHGLEVEQVDGELWITVNPDAPTPKRASKLIEGLRKNRGE